MRAAQACQRCRPAGYSLTPPLDPSCSLLALRGCCCATAAALPQHTGTSLLRSLTAPVLNAHACSYISLGSSSACTASAMLTSRSCSPVSATMVASGAAVPFAAAGSASGSCPSAAARDSAAAAATAAAAAAPAAAAAAAAGDPGPSPDPGAAAGEVGGGFHSGTTVGAAFLFLAVRMYSLPSARTLLKH